MRSRIASKCPRAGTLVLGLLVIGLTGRLALASGFVLYDQTAAALAQGSAVVGGVQDASANWFNPAGLAFGRQASVSGTLGLAAARSTFSPEEGARVRGNARPQVVPNAFAALPVSQRFTLGLGIFAPYGYAVGWPEDWLGREKAIAVRVAVVAMNLNLAWRLSNRLSLSVGASPLYGSVKFAVGLPADLGSRGDFEGSGWNWQGNLGVMWKAIANVLSVGASYRGFNHQGRSRLNLQGQAKFDVSNPTLAQTFMDQSARASLALPDIFSVGTSWRVTPTWTWGLQGDLTRWSVFDRLEIRFEQPITPTQIIERKSRDALSLRSGVEYTGWRPHIPLRAGVHFEQNTARPASLAPSAPDGNRVGFSLGAGFVAPGVCLDVGYLLLLLLPAKAAGGLEGPAGTYATQAHMFALTFTKGAP